MHALGHHHYHAARLGGLAKINAVHSLRSIAEGVSSIFIPLFLLSQHYSLTSVLGYLCLFSFFWLITQPAGAWIVKKAGIRNTMALSIVSNIIQYILLFSLATYNVPLYLIAFFGGLSVTLYWLPFRMAFIQLLAHHDKGKNVGISNALLILAGGVTPAIGGIVATLFGTSALYGAAIAMFVLALVPLFMLRNFKVPEAKPVKIKEILPDLIANGAFNVDDAVEYNIWPLFIFLFIPSYAGVGTLASVTLLSAIAISLYAGAHEKRKSIYMYMRAGSTLAGIANFSRILAQGALYVFGVNFVTGSGKSLALTPYITRYCINGERYGITYLNMMLIAGGIAWTLFFGLLTLLTLFLGAKSVALVGLLLGAPAIFLVSRMR
jgi:MFS family permease